MRNSTLGDVSLWLLGTMNYKVSHSPLRSPANDRVQLSLALRQHGTWTAQLYQAICLWSAKNKDHSTNVKRATGCLLALCFSDWALTHSGVPGLFQEACFYLSLSCRTLTPLESTRLCYQGILVQPYGHTAPPMGKVALAQGVVFPPHGMREVFSKAWPGRSSVTSLPSSGLKGTVGHTLLLRCLNFPQM